jgi:hypothetical protein
LRGMVVWVWGLTAWGDEVMQISLCAFFGLTSSTTATASQVDYLQVAARVLSDLKAGVQPRVGVNVRPVYFLNIASSYCGNKPRKPTYYLNIAKFILPK